MAATYGVIHRFEGGTEEQYRKGLEVVHRDGGSTLPVGQTVHAAGTTDDGWIVVALFESKEAWETFRDETLLPGLGSVEGGFEGPPVEVSFEIVNFQTG
jgi:hypothetical protein